MTKIELIKEYKDTAIAAFNFYLDYLYNLTDNFIEEGRFKEGLDLPEDLKKLLSDSLTTANRYEKIREKLIKDDFNLSTVEIDYIGLVIFFWVTITSKHITTLQQAVNKASDIQNQLLADSDLDKSKIIDIVEIQKVN